jgi:hypothetical protein
MPAATVDHVARRLRRKLAVNGVLSFWERLGRIVLGRR